MSQRPSLFLDIYSPLVYSCPFEIEASKIYSLSKKIRLRHKQHAARISVRAGYYNQFSDAVRTGKPHVFFSLLIKTFILLN